jgi:hypothetical protein
MGALSAELRTSPTLVAELIAHLAHQRGDTDPRYAPTIGVCAASRTTWPKTRASARPSATTIDRLVDAYLEALRSGKWAAPTREGVLARTVTNHLKAFVKAKDTPLPPPRQADFDRAPKRSTSTTANP